MPIMHSSYPPGAARDGQRHQLGINPSQAETKGFRSQGRGENHGHIGRTTIHPMKPQGTHPKEVFARVHGLFGKKVT